MASYALSPVQLPWSLTNDEERFKKILKTLFAVYLLVAIPLTIIQMPEQTRAEREQLPPQLARMMLEKQELPPPVPIEPAKVEEKKPEDVKAEEKKPEEKKPEEKKIVERPAEKTPIKASEQPVKNSGKASDVAVTQAREKAANSGIMQFKDDLMEMRETLQTTAVETASTTVSNGAGQATQVDRSMINSGVTRGSGGINVGAYASHDTGGVALGGRQTTKVTSGLAEATKKAAAGSGAGNGVGNGNSDGAGGAARSEEEVRKVMEQHKGAIFNIYNRALRANAALQGKVVVKIVIDPSGQVMDATIVSSELKDAELEVKLLQRIKLITFSSSNVTRTTLNYSFDFLPQ